MILISTRWSGSSGDLSNYFTRPNAARSVDGPYKGKALKGELSGLFSLRVGDYRVIYWINEKEGIVWLIDVGHRKRVYNRV